MGDERAAHSDELKMQVAEPIKALSFKWEDYRKRCELYNGRLLEDREKTYTDLKHTQKKYFDQCSVVEKERMKVSHDSKSQKHNRQLQMSMADMNNMKNSYLIAIDASNAHKKKYYHEDIPDLLNTFQDLNEIRVQKLNVIWQKATQLEQSCLIRQGGHLGASIEAIGRNQPTLDTSMFIQHNVSNFNEPAAFGFEECPIWHDTADLVVDETAKVFLQNALARSKRELQEITPTVVNKKHEIDGLNKLKANYAAEPARGNIEDVIMNLLSSKLEITTYDNRRNKLVTEIACVTRVAGEIDRGMTEHTFKSASFAIPTNCDFCGSTIWGMSRKGYHCKACSYNCHKNCQMKVPANCTQEKGNKRTADTGNGTGALSRTDTTNSTADSVYGVRGTKAQIYSDSEDDQVSISSSDMSSGPTRKTSTATRRSLAPPPSSGYAAGTSTSSGTTALYAYDATSPEELSIAQGESVTVLTGDDGAGWVRVRGPRGVGLVPATYLENPTVSMMTTSTPALGRTTSASSTASSMRPAGRQGPTVAPKRAAQKKGRQVRALYDYQAGGPGELSIVEGDLINLTIEDAGDGWATGELGGRSGIFPAAYAA